MMNAAEAAVEEEATEEVGHEATEKRLVGGMRRGLVGEAQRREGEREGRS